MYVSTNRMFKEAPFVSVQSGINLISEFLLKCIIRDSHASLSLFTIRVIALYLLYML